MKKYEIKSFLVSAELATCLVSALSGCTWLSLSFGFLQQEVQLNIHTQNINNTKHNQLQRKNRDNVYFYCIRISCLVNFV